MGSISHASLFIKCTLAAFAMMPLAVIAQLAGDLDTSFANTGKIADLAIGVGASSVQATLVQPDGKIVLAGYCGNGTYADFCVVRLNANGSIDGSFAATSAAGAGKLILSVNGTPAFVRAAALQADGKIVLAGFCDRSSSGGNVDFCVARITSDGVFDPDFGLSNSTRGGTQILPIGTGSDLAYALAIQADGKIVIAGTCGSGNNEVLCMARLNADGGLDTSFAPASLVGPGKLMLPPLANAHIAFALAIQADAKIVVAGVCERKVNTDVCVVRLNPNGTFDTSFAPTSSVGAGKLILPIGSAASTAAAVALQNDGKMLLGGTCGTGFCAARLNANGSIDTSFAPTSSEGAGKLILPIGSGESVVFTATLQPDGKFVLAGSCINGAASTVDFCAVRLNINGSIDSSFVPTSPAGAGKLVLPIGSNEDAVLAITSQLDGKLVLAGQCVDDITTRFCVARMWGTSASANPFSVPTLSAFATMVFTAMLMWLALAAAYRRVA
jgi:uncharacterized delta-60 repeat protein